jgi:hypothetical protein
MSDELYAKMKAAADTAIQAATPAEDSGESADAAAPEESSTLGGDAPAAEEQPVEAEAQADEGEVTEAADEEADEPEQEDLADQILAVRQAADRRVRQAEGRARELEAKLEKMTERVEMSRKEVVEELFKKLRRAPARTFKEHGFEFQDLIDAGMREGQFHDGAFGELDEVRAQIRELQKEREEMQRARQEQEEHKAYQSARREFLGQVSEKQFPTLYNMFQDDPEPLWIEAQRIAEQHEEQHGEAPEDMAVIQYLEKKYRARLERLSGKAPSAPAVAAAGKKPAPKTISTKAASESRTAGKPFGQLSSEEQRAALVAAVKKATSQATN